MQQTKLLQKYGNWAIVTGASNGLGKEFAIQLAKIGFNVVLVARRKSLLKELSSQLEKSYGIKSMSINLDGIMKLEFANENKTLTSVYYLVAKEI